MQCKFGPTVKLSTVLNYFTKIILLKKKPKTHYCLKKSKKRNIFILFHLCIYPPDSQKSDGGANT